jgi:hypothetical protein
MNSWRSFFITQVCHKQGLTETGLSKREEEILLAKFPDEETIRTNKQVADYLTGNKICTPENIEVQMRTIYNERFSPENCKDPPDFQDEIGQKRDPFFQAWLKLKYQEYSLVTRRSASDSLSATPAIASEPGWRSRFQALIEDKTKDFVGRNYVFDAIADFLTNQPNGYFIIEGDPGMGKSAILAEYVRQTGCVAHFNVQGEYETVEEFLKTVRTELISRYQLTSLPIPADAKQYGAFLNELLAEAAQKRNGERVVIAIDALDEVDSASHPTNGT